MAGEDTTADDAIPKAQAGIAYIAKVAALTMAAGKLPAATAGGPLAVWMHDDTRGMDAAIVAALAALESGAALSVRDVRALLVLTIANVDLLSSKGPEGPDAAGGVQIVVLGDRGAEQFAADDRRRVAGMLYRSWAIVQAKCEAQYGVLPPPASLRWISVDDGATQYATGPTLPVPAAGPWAVGAGVAVGIVGASLIAAWVYSSRASERVSVAIAEATTRNLMAQHGAVLRVLELHAEKERIAGKQLAFDAGELRVIDALQAAQDHATTGLKIGANVQENHDKQAGSAIAGIGSGLVIVAGLIAVLAFARR